MIIKRSFCFCVEILLFTAVSVKANNLENSGDSTLVGQLIARVRALEERDAVQQKLIDDLQNEVSDQRKDMGRMKQSLATRDRRIWSLLHSMRRQETLANPEQQTKMADTLRRSVDDRQSEEAEPAVKRIRQTVITVAFSAALSKTMSPLGTHQDIVFDHVFTNVGNGYNAHHGVFVAPVPGTYVFFMTIRALHNHDIWSDFVVNGIQKSTTYAQSMNGGSDSSSQTIILQLKQGDDVAVQLINAAAEVYGTGYLYSTFSGFLLSDDFTQPSNIIG